MKTKGLIIFIISLLFLVGGLKPVFAVEHAQKDGLFSLDIPAEWHWVEYAQQVMITYPDAKTVALDIQFVPSDALAQADIKKILKEGNDKMINEGVKAHNGTVIHNKETTFGGVYATRLDFSTTPPNRTFVSYISFFNKNYAYTITYGSEDPKMFLMMQDVSETFKFK